MQRIARLILTSVLALIVLSSACNLPAQTPPTPVGTILSTGPITSTPSPTNTLSNETPTAFIPITGLDVVALQCQFCVNEEAHAVLIMSKLASFNVSDPASEVTCLMAQDVNDRRVVLCRGAQQASFNLNVCVGDANCLEFPITLQPCSLVPQTGTGTPRITFTPRPSIFLTPRPRTPGPTQTDTNPVPTVETATPDPQPTAVPTQSTPVSTQPEPTQITTEPPPVSTLETEPPAPLPTSATDSIN